MWDWKDRPSEQYVEELTVHGEFLKGGGKRGLLSNAEPRWSLDWPPSTVNVAPLTHTHTHIHNKDKCQKCKIFFYLFIYLFAICLPARLLKTYLGEFNKKIMEKRNKGKAHKTLGIFWIMLFVSAGQSTGYTWDHFKALRVGITEYYLIEYCHETSTTILMV